MRVRIVGGGPSGLCLAILLKQRDSNHEVVVYERNRATDTFGWGVVFSDQTLGNVARAAPQIAEQVVEELVCWEDIEIRIRGMSTRSTGHGFFGIGRLRLLQILQKRAEELGVEIQYETEIDSIDEFRGNSDLIVAADGLHSRVRTQFAEAFGPRIDLRRNKFIWLGTHKLFDAFTFAFVQTEHGFVQAHAYRFDDETSTFIVECPEETWRGFGGDDLTSEASIELCERLFADHLDGHALMSRAKHRRGREWMSFPRVDNDRWHFDNIVLLGDAAHTAHFSIGSGTKLGFEDAIELDECLNEHESVRDALKVYQERRRTAVLRLQSAARNSTEWFENVERYAQLPTAQFCYSLLTRSQRIGHKNLGERDHDGVEAYESWFAARAGAPASPVPPMFTPFSLRDMTLTNRVVVSPMAMYSANEGCVSDFHLVHLGARAMGGAAMVMTEMTAVSADARITPRCAGMYNDEHVSAWKRIVDYVHGETDAKIGMQLGHAGPKGATKVPSEGSDVPLDEGSWPLLAPSAVPYHQGSRCPRAATTEDLDAVRDAFVRATQMADASGFDFLELHCAHGYLLSAFITPLLNQRTDAYGGPLCNRLRFPLEVFGAMRRVWPKQKPMSVRISATDWVVGGVDAEESVDIATAFKEMGVDIIDVSSGQTSLNAEPVYGRMFQTPLSDRIRNEASVPTMAVGNIYEPDHVNTIVASGRADLCCIGRPHLANPNWTLLAAAQQRIALPWPTPYEKGRAQLARILERRADTVIRI